MITVDSIIENLERSVNEKIILGPEKWLNASQTLLILIGDESDKLFQLEHTIAQMKVKYMESGDTAAKAKIRSEALPEYLEIRKLKAKIDRVFELIRIAKIQARLTNDNFQSH